MNISKTLRIGIQADTNYSQKNLTSNTPLVKEPVSSAHSNDDTVFISNEAKMILDEQSSVIAEMLKQLEEPSSKSEDSFDDKLKCILIAIRIINGDNVPSKDRKFLAEKEPEMYSNALLLRRKNDKPKKYNSLLEDKEDDSTTRVTESNNATVEAASELTIDLEA